jgi:1-deoxy-D-xylulose-5-phosphate reductoisomerase
MAMRRIAIVGSTGSVGTQALDVIENTSSEDDQIELVGLGALSSWETVCEQAVRTDCQTLYLRDSAAATSARESSVAASVTSNFGEFLERSKPDLVFNAVVGTAGLEITLAALEAGVDVALANKESLVAGGSLCLEAARKSGARIIPVDSEHSALMWCMASGDPYDISSLVLTASGGPFLGRTRDELAHVTAEQALQHPTWNMGGKISVDSATLMNKGLELIEAHVLFDMPVDDIEIVVQPTSIVHALVRYRDGSLLAHLGWPDMRTPIASALWWPRRVDVPVRHLDLASLGTIAFQQPDTRTFRCLELARQAALEGQGSCCVLTAANEFAVDAFLKGGLDFLDIEQVVEEALDVLGGLPAPESLEEVHKLDASARAIASDCLARGMMHS